MCEDNCWKESIGDDDVEDAVDGVNDEDGFPRGMNEGGSDGYNRHQRRMAQALETINKQYSPEFVAGRNHFDVENAEDTIVAPTTRSEKQVYM